MLLSTNIQKRMSNRSKFYLTSALPYVNSAPHMGHALEIVQADVVARYRRVLGDDVVFLTGADEHGAKIVRSAEHAGKAPQAFVDDQGQFFLKLLRELGIS